MSKFVWRDLGLLIVGPFAGSILPAVAAHGVAGVTLTDLDRAGTATAVGFLSWLIAYCTPVTRKYGIGSEPVPIPPAPVDSSPPII